MEIDLDYYLQALDNNPALREFLRQKRKADNDFEHTKKVMHDEGKAEGRLEKAYESAKLALDIGIPISQISLITGLTENKIEELKR
jgi:hypothetical protein